MYISLKKLTGYEREEIQRDSFGRHCRPVLYLVARAEGCADIPGLIEGASEGIGLGHDFLRHVERCRLLLHVVDVSGSECREPIEDFEKINEELAKFSPVLAERPQIVVGNKCDLATEEQIEAFRKYVEGKGLTFVPISAATMQGVKELPGLVYNRLKDIPPVPVFAPVFPNETVNITLSVCSKHSFIPSLSSYRYSEVFSIYMLSKTLS